MIARPKDIMPTERTRRAAHWHIDTMDVVLEQGTPCCFIQSPQPIEEPFAEPKATDTAMITLGTNERLDATIVSAEPIR
jgi:hypothetical protein